MIEEISVDQTAIRRNSGLLSLRSILGNVHNLVLENKKIGLAVTSESHHILVVVLDPATHYFTIRQLDIDRRLFFTQGL